MSAMARDELHRLDQAYRPALLAYFVRRLQSRSEAEDMTQEVFLRLAGADRSRIRSAEAYVFQVAANLLRDRARREKHQVAYRGELLADEAFGVDPISPERIVDGRQSLRLLVEALQELPELTRRVFICHRLEAIPRSSIARAFRISEAAVDRHLAKALAHLTQRVREGGP